MKAQPVYVHLVTHNVNPQEGTPISWQILHSNVNKHNERQIIEALEIRKHTGSLMNGCIGRTICI